MSLKNLMNARLKKEGLNTRIFYTVAFKGNVSIKVIKPSERGINIITRILSDYDYEPIFD